MRDFVDYHRDTFGIEPICRVLQIAPSGYRRYVAQKRNPALRPDRTRHDEALLPEMQRVWQEKLQVYGAEKVWRPLDRERFAVARCTVERLMRRLGLEGARRGKNVKTTIADPALPCPLDRVNRQFKAERPNQLWVSNSSPMFRPGRAGSRLPLSLMCSLVESWAGARAVR